MARRAGSFRALKSMKFIDEPNGYQREKLPPVVSAAFEMSIVNIFFKTVTTLFYKCGDLSVHNQHIEKVKGHLIGASSKISFYKVALFQQRAEVYLS